MTTTYHTPIPFNAPVNSSVVNGPLGTLDAQLVTQAAAITAVNNLFNQLIAGTTAFGQLNLGITTTLTISGGAITVSRTRHRVDTEAAAASDDLDTINGFADGDWLRLQLVSAARVVNIRHNGGGTGNIRTDTGATIVLDDLFSWVDLLYDSTHGYWMAR